MRRLMFPVSAVAVLAACLLALGRVPAARAEAATGPLDRLVATWMGVVGVIGADADLENEPASAESVTAEADENTFTIDEEGEDGEAREDKAKRRREHRDRDHREGGRRHHRGGHPQGEHAHRDHGHGGPPMGGPHHPGMGPGRMGPPGGPDMHHPAMRAFHEIIRRLGRIEEKLGIESGPPSGPRGMGSRGPRPEMPEEMRRQMKQRMEVAKGRMEEARKRFQAMEERIKQLEAEVERLKAAK